jgi:molybdopterin-binding protein
MGSLCPISPDEEVVMKISARNKLNKLATGQAAYAVIKASDVMVAID